MVVWRLSEQVSGKWDVDITFTDTGFFRHKGAAWIDGNNDFGKGITIDSQGRIIIAGTSANSSSYRDMAVWRLAQINGTWQLDTSFNNTGYFVHGNATGGNRNDVGQSIAIDNNQRILVTGRSQATASDYDMVIWRLSIDNQQNWGLDQSFNGVGYLVQSAAGVNVNDYGNNIVVDSLGRILVTGYSGLNMAIWQYKLDSNNQWGLDSDFNGSGFVYFPNGRANEMLLDPQDRIYITGSTNSEMGVWSFR